jgi:hypothetical protein
MQRKASPGPQLGAFPAVAASTPRRRRLSWWLVVVLVGALGVTGGVLLGQRRASVTNVGSTASVPTVTQPATPDSASSAAPIRSNGEIAPSAVASSSAARSSNPVPANSTLVQEARTTLETLRVAGRAAKTGYDRDLFGEPWADVDGNRCDTRNDILARDLGDPVLQLNSFCVIVSGALDDPYSGKKIVFQRRPRTSSTVQIDHVVALSDAWQKGAQQWTADRRLAFANDPLNLLAVDGDANTAKGDGDAASWLPPARRYRCPYVARQVAVKARYGLTVTVAERQAVLSVLRSCTDSVLLDSATPTATPHPTAPSKAPACEPAYPTICLLPAAGSPDLDCGDISERSFVVRAPDPYRLDGRDGDGFGCES